jgi:ABC-type Mn2+/Zn2+ transport system ATPase subunit
MYNLHLNDPLFLPHCGCEIGLSLQSGEMITFVGENGIGKTSLVQRFYQEYASQMTLVDQKSLDIFYDRSLKKVKEIFLDARGDRLDKEFFLKSWSLFGLDAKEGRLQSSLSGGEGQALKIALGLAPLSDIYVLDEPSHYLDESMRKNLNTLLQDLISKNKSIIMVEHNYSWVKIPMKVFQLVQYAGTLKIGKTWNT